MPENEKTNLTVSSTKSVHQEKTKDNEINTHFILAVVAICASCLTGFVAIPLAIAALIMSLRAQDLLMQARTEDAARSAYWAAVFGWITILLALLPILAFIFFGGALLTVLATLIGAVASA